MSIFTPVLFLFKKDLIKKNEKKKKKFNCRKKKNYSNLKRNKIASSLARQATARQATVVSSFKTKGKTKRCNHAPQSVKY